MDSTSDSPSPEAFAKHADFISSASLPSCPSPTGSRTSCPPTPDIMDCDQSNNEARSSEPMTESPTQEYVLPNHQGDRKLESNVVSNQRILGSEPNPDSPAQENLFPRSQEGEESSVAMIVHQVFDDDDGQTTVSLPRSAAFNSVNMVSEKFSNSPQSDGPRQESREQSPTAGDPDSQQPQLRQLDRPLDDSWRESNVTRTRDSSARESSSVDDQRRPGAEVMYPTNNPRAGPPVLERGLCDNPPETTTVTVSHGGNVRPQLQLITLPLSEVPDPVRNQEECLLPINDTSLPSIAELVKPPPPQADRWSSRPKYKWTGVLPNIYESRRLELQAPDGRPSLLVQGPTRHLGPPLKPFDDAKSEDIALEQWRRVMRERELTEAGGL